MKTIIFTYLLAITVSAQSDPYKKVWAISDKFEVLPLNSVKPTGWLKDQIQHNLDGFTGHLDELAPDLIVSDDIYDKNRLSNKVKSKDVGAIGGEGDWQVQFLWWNSETQSNWRDGYIRSAILANDKTHLTKVERYVERILASQDKDGYLGIYDSELRYNFDNENGELWAQTTLLRGLLAWYDYTKDAKVLSAVKRAVDNTMKGFPIDASHPFYSKNENVGGLSHGLTFTDVLEDLHRITRNQKYLDYALFLYKDFSQNKLNEDAQLPKLKDPDRMLTGHGVHTYEHLRSLAAAYRASGNPELRQAIANFERKIMDETTATGAPVGDEWIGGRKADATNRGYEYCSLQELMHSYESLLAKTGNADYGDKIETLFFNAAQGARHPEQSCIAYLKSDNSYEMSGGLNGDKSDAKQTRYRYSPVHKEAAVCCVPNAGRIAPYFVQYMWMKTDTAIAATLLGPSVVHTRVGKTDVKIVEKTGYPFGNDLEFEVTAHGTFDLMVRKPDWLVSISSNLPYFEKDGFLVFSKKWTGTESVILKTNPTVRTRQDLNGEFYFTYGALVLTNPIASKPQVTRTYGPSSFHDVNYTAENLVVYKFGKPADFTRSGDLKFSTSLWNPQTGKEDKVVLEPVGRTILRQVTFKR